MYNYSVAFKYAGEEREVTLSCSTNFTSKTYAMVLKDFAAIVIGGYLKLHRLQKEGVIPYAIRLYSWDENWESKDKFYSTANLGD